MNTLILAGEILFVVAMTAFGIKGAAWHRKRTRRTPSWAEFQSSSGGGFSGFVGEGGTHTSGDCGFVDIGGGGDCGGGGH